MLLAFVCNLFLLDPKFWREAFAPFLNLAGKSEVVHHLVWISIPGDFSHEIVHSNRGISILDIPGVMKVAEQISNSHSIPYATSIP